MPYPELDGRDLAPATRHLWTSDDDGPTAYLRVLSEAGSRRIGRVCTRLDVRGAGLAGKLVRPALQLHPHGSVVLDAQSHLRAGATRK